VSVLVEDIISFATLGLLLEYTMRVLRFVVEVDYIFTRRSLPSTKICQHMLQLAIRDVVTSNILMIETTNIKAPAWLVHTLLFSGRH